MPTRNQIRTATPRCPGTKAGTSNWQECGKLLVWNHDWASWVCDKHGVVSQDDQIRGKLVLIEPPTRGT